jgi:hypothetical protein
MSLHEHALMWPLAIQRTMLGASQSLAQIHCYS